MSKYKDLVNDYTEGELLAKGNGRDFNWNYFVNQSALSTKTRFGIVPRNEFELNTDKGHYLNEYSSPQFQNALTILRLNMNEILKDGKHLKTESLALIDMLETEIKKFKN